MARQTRTARQSFRNAMGRDPGRVNSFNVSLTKENTSPKPLDRAALFHYWHPDRSGVEQAPERIQTKLNAIAGFDEDGRPKAVIVRPPAGAPTRCHCWLVFKRAPEITAALSPGWFLVLAWHDGDEPRPKPLNIDDDRLWANLYLQSVKAGREVIGRDFDKAVDYFDHAMKVADENTKRTEREIDQYRDDRAKDYFDYTKIKNIGHGSKFALHHDGTIMPTKQEEAWLRERGHSLPGQVVERDRDEIKRAGTTVRSGGSTPLERERQRETAHMMEEISRMRSRVSVGLQRPQESAGERAMRQKR